MNQVSGDGTVGKAIQVLDTIAQFARPVRFSEIQTASDLPKATLYRLMQTLTNQGMLSYDESTQTYSMGLKLVRLAHVAWSQASMAKIAAPYLNELCINVRETVHLAQIEAGHVLFVDKKRPAERFETLAQVGLVAPAYCTGVGKAILAFLSPARLERAMLRQTFERYTEYTISSTQALLDELEQVRASGVAFDREEHEMGVISIAAPIKKSNGEPLGAVSIATSTSRHTISSLQTFKDELLDCVTKIGAEAESWVTPQTS